MQGYLSADIISLDQSDCWKLFVQLWNYTYQNYCIQYCAEQYVLIKIVRSILLFSEFILSLRLRAMVCLMKNEVCINHVYIHEPMFESVIYLRLQGIWYSISKPASSGDCHFSPNFQDVRACNRYNKTRLNSLVIMSLSHFINLTVPWLTNWAD